MLAAANALLLFAQMIFGQVMAIYVTSVNAQNTMVHEKVHVPGWSGASIGRPVFD
jgi:hypothetical protein